MVTCTACDSTRGLKERAPAGASLGHTQRVDAGFNWKILLVEDEEFTRSLLANLLTQSGAHVQSAASTTEALQLLESFEPHVVMTDLDLGIGPSGAHLLRRVAEDAPWVGLVTLSAHASPELAVRDSGLIPDGTVSVVKSDVHSVGDLLGALEAAVIRRVVHDRSSDHGDRIVLSQVHGEILRLISEGFSNAGIAKERNTTLRAAEGMVQRTFLALGLHSDPDRNARVLAVRLWQQGKVVIR